MSHPFQDLSAQLQQLASEAKRKHSDVKQAADEALAALKTDAPACAAQLQQATKGSQPILLQPVLLGCASKNAKVIQHALSCLKRLLATPHSVSEALVPDLLANLRTVSTQGVEIQLIILQILVSVISNTAVHGDLLADTLLLCFRLQESRIGVVSSTAAATLRQLIILLFDRVAAEDASTGKDTPESNLFELAIPDNDEPIYLHPAAADAYRVLADLCSLVSGTKSAEPSFLQLTTLPKTFGLELIESVLSDFHAVFTTEHPELIYLLKSSLSPMLIRSLAGDVGVQPQFSVTLRLMRVIFLLLKVFNDHLPTECEIFYQMFIKIIAPGEVEGSGGHPLGISTNPSGNSNPNSHAGVGTSPTWMRVLALEILRGLCSDFELLKNAWDRYDAKAAREATSPVSESTPFKPEDQGILLGLLTALSRLAAERPNLLGVCTSITMGATVPGDGLISMADAANAVEFSAETSAMKLQCIDQLDKADPPVIPETYVFLLALQCLTAIANSFYSSSHPLINEEVTRRCAADNSLSPSAPRALQADSLAQDSPLRTTQAMIAAIWPPLLFSLSFFISTNLSEALFASVLAASKSFTVVCGLLDLPTPRDAFLSSLCKFAIPPLVVASISSNELTGLRTSQQGQSLLSSGADALGLSNRPPQTAGLSPRNLACLNMLISVADQLAGVLEWFNILEALQNAEFVLRLSAGAKKRQDESEARANIARLFETTSTAMDDAAFSLFLQALARLSSEMVGMPAQVFKESEASKLPEVARRRASGISTTRNVRPNETSFGIGKMGDVCALNIHRLVYRDASVAWDIVTLHLLTLQHWPPAPPNLRLQAAETLGSILEKATGTVSNADQETQLALQSRLIAALEVQASDVYDPEETHLPPSATDIEIRKMAYESLYKLLENSGHSLLCGWTTVLNMLKTACGLSQNTNLPPRHPTAQPGTSRASALVSVAFPSLRLICTDFLAGLSMGELRLAIETLMVFATQWDDVNIALTTGGLLQQVSDYLCMRREQAIDDPVTSKELNEIWMMLLHELLRLCQDDRAEVRDAAIKFLFHSFFTHAAFLSTDDWQTCLWDVILALLKTSRTKTSGTNVKAIDDSQILVFNSVGRLCREYLVSKIVQTPRFQELVAVIVKELREAFLTSRPDVATVAINNLQHIASAGASSLDHEDEEIRVSLRSSVQQIWAAWTAIGLELETRAANKPDDQVESNALTQQNLQSFVEALPPLLALENVKASLENNKQVLAILKTVLTWTGSPEQRPDIDTLTPLQAAVLGSVELLDTNLAGVSSLVLSDLSYYCTLAFVAPFDPPPPAQSDNRIPVNRKITYIALSKAAMPRAMTAYLQQQRLPEIYTQGAVEALLKAYEIPLKLKYECPSANKFGSDPPLWRTAANHFLVVARAVAASLQSLELRPSTRENVWRQLNACYRAGVLADTTSIASLPSKQQRAAEDFDLGLLASLEQDILPRLADSRTPDAIITDLAQVVQQGSRLYQLDVPAVKKGWFKKTDQTQLGADDRRFALSFDVSPGIPLNGTTANAIETNTERFAYWCFDLLFLVCHEPAHKADRRLAVLFLPHLLNRCQFAIESFVADSKIRGKSPFPRIRQEELAYVLSKLLNLELADGVYAEAYAHTVAKGAENLEHNNPQLRQHKHAHILHLLRFLPDLLALSNLKTHNDKPYRLSSAATDVVGMPAGDVIQLGAVGRADCPPEQTIKVSVPELARRMFSLVVGLVVL